MWSTCSMTKVFESNWRISKNSKISIKNLLLSFKKKCLIYIRDNWKKSISKRKSLNFVLQKLNYSWKILTMMKSTKSCFYWKVGSSLQLLSMKTLRLRLVGEGEKTWRSIRTSWRSIYKTSKKNRLFAFYNSSLKVMKTYRQLGWLRITSRNLTRTGRVWMYNWESWLSTYWTSPPTSQWTRRCNLNK